MECRGSPYVVTPVTLSIYIILNTNKIKIMNNLSYFGLPRPGMRLIINLFKPVGGDMGVNLGGGDALMAQEFLDTAQVRAVVQ